MPQSHGAAGPVPMVPHSGVQFAICTNGINYKK